MDASHFLFTSDLPIDKIAFATEGEMTTDADGVAEFTAAHDFGVPVFPEGIWSTDDFATSWTFGTTKYSGDTISVRSSIIGNKTNIVGNVVMTPNTKIRYRVWGFITNNEINTEVPKTGLAVADRFTLDTDYNYPKLVTDGIANKGDTVRVDGLKGMQSACVWADMAGDDQYSPISDGIGEVYGGFGDFAVFDLEENKIDFYDLVGAAQKYYYRIYK